MRGRAKNILSHSNRGRALEIAVAASQRVICVDKHNAGARFRSKAEMARDPSGGRVAALRGAVDFIGEVRGSGRAVHFDAKQTTDADGFRHAHHLSIHQRDHLAKHGDAGAICGVLIEAIKPGRFFWLGWEPLVRLWSIERFEWSLMIDLGDTLHNINFERVPEIGASYKNRSNG